MSQPEQIKAGIIGGAGYTGGELVRLLLNHEAVDLSFVQSSSNAGKLLSQVHRDLEGDTDLVFAALPDMEQVDVLFLCGAHGSSRRFLQEQSVPAQVKVIDLSSDFRLQPDTVINGRGFVYGLPECNKEQIALADNIANPGCFATAIQLSLAPLAAAGLLGAVQVTGITGSTGAGQSLSATSHFSWRSGNISAYKTLQHQHVPEVQQTLSSLQPGYKSGLWFIPWRGDFPRGIYTSAMTDCSLSQQELMQLYRDFYTGAPFVRVNNTMIDMKQVINTNKCLLYPELIAGKMVIHAAIDNLLKGACGQAVQNMNLLFGLPETTGLRLKSIAF